MAGLVVGEVADRGDWFWPVSWDVVVAVDIGTSSLLGECVEGPAAQTGGGTGLEKSLAGDGFQALGSPVNHRGDHGAVCHHGTESGGENPGWTPIHGAAGFYRAAAWGREGYPIGR